jgi:hypothetical protein
MDTKTYMSKRCNDKRLYFRIHWGIDYCPYINKIFSLYIRKRLVLVSPGRRSMKPFCKAWMVERENR